MEQMHPFNWDFSNPNAINYGDYYWGILLNDGRYVYLNADKAVVSDTGDLIMMRMKKYSLTKVELETIESLKLKIGDLIEKGLMALVNREDAKLQKLFEKKNDFVMEPTMVLAQGHWVSYFAANFVNGTPVSLDNAVEYTKDIA